MKLLVNYLLSFRIYFGILLAWIPHQVRDDKMKSKKMNGPAYGCAYSGASRMQGGKKRGWLVKLALPKPRLPKLGGSGKPHPNPFSSIDTVGGTLATTPCAYDLTIRCGCRAKGYGGRGRYRDRRSRRGGRHSFCSRGRCFHCGHHCCRPRGRHRDGARQRPRSPLSLRKSIGPPLRPVRIWESS